MNRVRYHPAAGNDIQTAVDFYDARRRKLGDAFLAVVRASARRLKEKPFLGPPLDGPIRRFVVQRFPYTIVYEPTPEGIYVLAVIHDRQEPDLWKGRL